MLFRYERSEWIQRENRECLLLEGWVPPILVADMGQSLVLRVHLLSIIITIERVVDETLYSFLQLNVRLGSRQNLTHPSDAMLQ